MAKLPKELARRDGFEIGESLDTKKYPNDNRSYLGYSTAGASCKRAMWYGFHWISNEKISARTNRIFETGHSLEETIIEDLIDNGYEVTDRQKEITDETGHVKGHIDGIIHMNESYFTKQYLLEIKTANDKNFKDITNRGVKLAKLGYYMQMQAYMGRLGLSQGLFLAYNKNDSSYYTEIIDFNPGIYADINRIFFSVLTAETPPDKISVEPDDFECQWCSFAHICHYGNNVDKNCRTCKYVDLEANGHWSCNCIKSTNFAANLTIDEQRTGCNQWKLNSIFNL